MVVRAVLSHVLVEVGELRAEGLGIQAGHVELPVSGVDVRLEVEEDDIGGRRGPQREDELAHGELLGETLVFRVVD